MNNDTAERVSPTPGPYEIEEYDHKFQIVRPWGDGVKPGYCATYGSCLGAHIAEVQFNGGVPTREQALANANLLCTAPDFLTACTHKPDGETTRLGWLNTVLADLESRAQEFYAEDKQSGLYALGAARELVELLTAAVRKADPQ